MADAWGGSWGTSWGNSWGAAAVVVVAEPAPRTDAGSGRKKQWWEGEWIIPGVTHYLPEKPPEDITPLRPKVEKLKKRLADTDARTIQDRREAADLRRQLSSLARSVGALERKAQAAVVSAKLEEAIGKVTDLYRLLSDKVASAEDLVSAHEQRMARFERLARDDEDFMVILRAALKR